jgi:hypothetical protein
MSDLIAIALIAAVPSSVSAVLSFLNNTLARRNERHISETRQAMQTLEKQTNSIKDALVKVTGEAEFAKGLKQGHEDSGSA